MPVEVVQEGAAAVVRLNWPEKRNALGPAEADEITDAIRRAAGSRAAAVVLCGAGAFCAGGDLRTFAELSERLRPDEIQDQIYGRVQAMIRALGDVAVPTIAAVDGPAIGLGMDLMLACDVRLVGRQGWALQGWGNAGLIAATGGVRFVSTARPGLLWRLLADQPRLDGPECERLGLATAVDGSALDAAIEQADRLGRLERAALLAYVALDRPLRWPSDEHLDEAARRQAALIGSAQFRAFAARTLGGAPRSAGPANERSDAPSDQDRPQQ